MFWTKTRLTRLIVSLIDARLEEERHIDGTVKQMLSPIQRRRLPSRAFFYQNGDRRSFMESDRILENLRS